MWICAGRGAILYRLRGLLLLRPRPGLAMRQGRALRQQRSCQHHRWRPSRVRPLSSRRHDLRQDARWDPRGDAGVDGRYLPNRLLRCGALSQEPARPRPQRVHCRLCRLRTSRAMCHHRRIDDGGYCIRRRFRARATGASERAGRKDNPPGRQSGAKD